MLYVIKTDPNDIFFYGQGVIDCKVCNRTADAIKSVSVPLKQLIQFLKLKPIIDKQIEESAYVLVKCIDCGLVEAFPICPLFTTIDNMLNEHGWTVELNIQPRPLRMLTRCPDCSKKVVRKEEEEDPLPLIIKTYKGHT